MTRTFLLTGFGAFLDVADNPSGRLAARLDGALLPDLSGGVIQICARVLPVQYDTCAAETLLAARQIGAIGILGMGVARGAAAPRVERTAHARADGVTPDARGEVRRVLGTTPELQSAHAAALARALGVALSDDAGGYVCNAWLYGVLAGATVPAAFLHLPDAGLEPEPLKAGLAAWIAGFGATG